MTDIVSSLAPIPKDMIIEIIIKTINIDAISKKSPSFYFFGYFIIKPRKKSERFSAFSIIS